jgi:uncharacterized LabA/DUF88 family protein
MKTIVIIIDFDNFFGSDISKISVEHLEFSFKELVSLCEKEFIEFSNIQIRLYGGWYKETELTKQASGIQQLLRNISVFPKIISNRVVNGEIELAVSLHIKPDFIWGYTYKETEGVRRIRLNHECIDSVCSENKNTCPKFLLYKFTDKKDRSCHVDKCMNLQKNVFKGAEQKMVDTLIACDIISTSSDENITGILVISDDQDHLPSLALASLKKTNSKQLIILAIQNEKIIDFISDFMAPFNIKTILIT